MDRPVDWSRLREQMVLEEEYEAAARTGRTSRGGAGSAVPPMERSDGKQLRARWGAGPMPKKKTRLGHLLRVWYAHRPRPRPRSCEAEWTMEVDLLREKLGMKEEPMAKQKRTRVSKDDIYQAVVLASPNGISAGWVQQKMGVDRGLAMSVLRELEQEGKVQSRRASTGPSHGPKPVEFYVLPEDRDAVIATVQQQTKTPKTVEQDHRLHLEIDLGVVLVKVEQLVQQTVEREVEKRLAPLREALQAVR